MGKWLRSLWGRWIVKQAIRDELRLAEMQCYGEEPKRKVPYPKHVVVRRGRV